MSQPTSERSETTTTAELSVALSQDEWQGLSALAEVRAAANNTEPDIAVTARALLHAALEDHLASAGLRWSPSPESVRKRAAQAHRPPGRLIALARNPATRRLTLSCLAVAALVILWGGYVQGWPWTGFRGNEQLWDWLRLLLLPVVVGTLPVWIVHPEYLSRLRRATYLTAVGAFAALVVAGYLVPLNWTGFPGNTLWNWLGLILLPLAIASVRFLPSASRALRRRHRLGLGVLAFAWVLTIAGGYAWHWTWTGYQGNTLWDWLGLLLLPLLIPTVVLPTALKWVAAGRGARTPQEASDAAARGGDWPARLASRSG